jgi:hypothetical protein
VLVGVVPVFLRSGNAAKIPPKKVLDFLAASQYYTRPLVRGLVADPKPPLSKEN